MRTIHIMSGVAGCGKSTWVREHAAWGDYVLSRDEFRENLRRTLGKPNDYFPCPEPEEWKLWTKHIIDCLHAGPAVDVWIDQTTLTQKALEKLLFALCLDFTDKDVVQVVVMNTPLDRIKEQNAQREGFARVPDSVIESMYSSACRNPIREDAIRYRFPSVNINVYHINAQG